MFLELSIDTLFTRNYTLSPFSQSPCTLTPCSNIHTNERYPSFLPLSLRHQENISKNCVCTQGRATVRPLVGVRGAQRASWTAPSSAASSASPSAPPLSQSISSSRCASRPVPHPLSSPLLVLSLMLPSSVHSRVHFLASHRHIFVGFH